MKFECGKKRHERVAAKQQWHRWFAWRPVRVDRFDCRWLEHVERRGDLICDHWFFYYRLPAPPLTTRETA